MNLRERKQIYDERYFRGRKSNYIFGYSNLRFSVFWRRRLKLLNRVANSGRLLDIGCAFGFFIKMLEKDFEVYGIDISEYAIEQTKRLISNPKNIKCFDVKRGIPFDEKFDVITALDILEHIFEPESVFNFLNASLKNDGYLYMELPLSSTLINSDVGHCYRSLKEWIDILKKAGFKPEFIQTYYTIGFRAIAIPTSRFINYCSIIAKKGY